MSGLLEERVHPGGDVEGLEGSESRWSETGGQAGKKIEATDLSAA